jgi:tetratricopeptide (TPR) repeat protein
MIFAKLALLIISAIGIGYAAFELNNFSQFQFIYNKGVEDLQAGRYRDAEKAFLKVLGIAPQMEENVYNLGLTYFYLNKLDAALDLFMKTIELNPKESDAYYNIGLCHYLKGNKKDTLTYFDKVLELSGRKDEGTLFGITMVYCELQDYDLAVQTVTRLIELQPKNIDYRMLLADIYEKLIAETGNIQSVDFAIKTYQEVLDIDESHEGANLKIANCYAQKGDIDECKSACQKALSKNSQATDAIQLLGIISFSLQEFKEAISFFSKVIELKPNSKLTYLNLAYAYAKMDDKENALATYKTYKEKASNRDIPDGVDEYFNSLETAV